MDKGIECIEVGVMRGSGYWGKGKVGVEIVGSGYMVIGIVVIVRGKLLWDLVFGFVGGEKCNRIFSRGVILFDLWKVDFRLMRLKRGLRIVISLWRVKYRFYIVDSVLMELF